ncbi:hypothetical protein C8J31_11464 [Rhizobium sp. PP-CC-2G-626]|nr:hypothetical protein C8J31_11464 [Rhizobium sp. PP-CC-2G-626]
MRKTQPKFVVEYKGGRRQKRGRGHSIWGTIDFNTLRGKIDQDNSPLITSSGGSHGGGAQGPSVEPNALQDGFLQPDIGPKSESSLSEEGCAFRSVSIDEPTERELKPESQHSADTDPRQPSPSVDAFESEAGSVKQDLNSLPSSTSADAIARVSAAVPVSRRDLAKLEAENVELRRLYHSRLLSERDWLSGTLARFVD